LSCIIWWTYFSYEWDFLIWASCEKRKWLHGTKQS
jgi:hypothetical protein